MRPVCSVRDVPGPYPPRSLHPPPLFFVSVASKEFNVCVSHLESIVRRGRVHIDSKGLSLAPKSCTQLDLRGCSIPCLPENVNAIGRGRCGTGWEKRTGSRPGRDKFRLCRQKQNASWKAGVAESAGGVTQKVWYAWDTSSSRTIVAHGSMHEYRFCCDTRRLWGMRIAVSGRCWGRDGSRRDRCGRRK